jgi:hypothetical protein
VGVVGKTAKQWVPRATKCNGSPIDNFVRETLETGRTRDWDTTALLCVLVGSAECLLDVPDANTDLSDEEFWTRVNDGTLTECPEYQVVCRIRKTRNKHTGHASSSNMSQSDFDDAVKLYRVAMDMFEAPQELQDRFDQVLVVRGWKEEDQEQNVGGGGRDSGAARGGELVRQTIDWTKGENRRNPLGAPPPPSRRSASVSDAPMTPSTSESPPPTLMVESKNTSPDGESKGESKDEAKPNFCASSGTTVGGDKIINNDECTAVAVLDSSDDEDWASAGEPAAAPRHHSPRGLMRSSMTMHGSPFDAASNKPPSNYDNGDSDNDDKGGVCLEMADRVGGS